MADIDNITPEERVIEIHHPADETRLLGIRVSIMAISDPRMKKIRRSINDEKLRLETKGKGFKSDDIDANKNKLMFNAMTGWEWYNPTGAVGDKNYDADAMPTFRGNVPAFNQVNAYAILTEKEWFADQISEAITDEKAFFAASKTI